jgi:hypothetical protein
MTTKNLYEIFDEIAAAETKEEKQNILANNDSVAMRQVVRAVFDPNIQFVFEEVPQYKKNESPPGLSETSLHMEVSRMYLFEKNNPFVAGGLTQERKRQLLIQILESLEAREAEVFINTLQKDLKVPGLDYELARNTFPGLLP